MTPPALMRTLRQSPRCLQASRLCSHWRQNKAQCTRALLSASDALSTSVSRITHPHHDFAACQQQAKLRRRWITGSTVDDSTPHITLDHETNQDLPGATISILTLNRPKAANAMGSVMLAQLKGCLTELEDLESPSRCVVLTSSSNKVFSAGADLKERATMTINQAADFVTDLRHTFDRLSLLPMPVIAAVEGIALGGGLELCLAADCIVASESATLGLPETSLAIVPGAGGTQRLARWIGAARAKQLIFTASRINGQTAREYGLVQDLVAPGLAQTHALAMAWKIAANGPVAVRAAKFAIDQGLAAGGGGDMKAALQIEEAAYQRVLATRDRYEGLDAFREQRKPEYRGH